jgi:hypothetical protein
MQCTISLPDELMPLIEGAAANEGKSLDAWIEQSLRARISDRSWQELLEYGRRNGEASGHSEADVPGIVRWRRKALSGS